MKLRFFSICASLGLVATASQAASTLMDMRFGNGNNDINEVTGWNGTTAPGGSLATGLTVTQGMRINGDFAPTAVNNDVFHVSNWRSPNLNPSSTFVSLILGAQPGYTFDLTGPGASFSTRVHQHPKTGGDATKIFDQVELVVGTTSFGFQPYTAGGPPQTLTWDLSSSTLSGLSSAEFKLYFTSTLGAAADPTGPQQALHGPEWGLADGAFVQVAGSVVPEPSRALLSMAGFLCLAIRRRK